MPEKIMTSRFPNLGKLSVAILENLVKPIIGEDAIGEIKSPVVERQLQDSLAKALEHTEKRFVAEHTDRAVCEAILNLPLANLPSIIQAVRGFYSRPTDSTLEQILNDQLTKNISHLSSERVTSGTTAYIRILREELVVLASDVREKLSTLANLSIQENTARIANTLDRMVTESKPAEHITQSHQEQLRHGLRERRNLELLNDAVREGEALYAEGQLPADLMDLLHSARKAFDEIRQEHGALTSKMRLADLNGRKEVCDFLEEQIVANYLHFYDATLNAIIPISDALQEARRSYLQASASTAQHELEKANKILPAHPFQAVAQLREALQKPFYDEDKHLLEEKLATAERLAMRMGRISAFIEQELTAQEQEIVKLAVVNDWTPKQIANHLQLSTTAVDIQVTKVCQKLQAHFGLEHVNLTTLAVLLSAYWV